MDWVQILFIWPCQRICPPHAVARHEDEGAVLSRIFAAQKIASKQQKRENMREMTISKT